MHVYHIFGGAFSCQMIQTVAKHVEALNLFVAGNGEREAKETSWQAVHLLMVIHNRSIYRYCFLDIGTCCTTSRTARTD